jgi:hypothetical protein
LPGRIGKEQPEDFRAYSGKENFQDRGRTFHNSNCTRFSKLDWFIQSSLDWRGRGFFFESSERRLRRQSKREQEIDQLANC